MQLANTISPYNQQMYDFVVGVASRLIEAVAQRRRETAEYSENESS